MAGWFRQPLEELELNGGRTVAYKTTSKGNIQGLTLTPRNAVAHAVRAIAGGPHALLGRVGSESADRFLMRNKDGGQAFLQDVKTKVAISLNAFAEGGSAFIDRNLDGGLSTGEAFPKVEGGGERRLTLPLEEFLGRSLPVYYSPPISPAGIQPDTVTLCAAVNSTVGSRASCPRRESRGSKRGQDALEPIAVRRHPPEPKPSRRWSLSTSANPGHCLFHSSRALSVVRGTN